VEGVTSSSPGEHGLLKSCVWKGLKIPCSKIFTTFPTDQGMCCTFNMDAAEKMFKDSKYQDMISFMQDRDKTLSYDKDDKMPLDWSALGEPKPQAGRSKGLSLILDAHSNLVSG
jgi:hypothetical protein